MGYRSSPLVGRHALALVHHRMSPLHRSHRILFYLNPTFIVGYAKTYREWVSEGESTQVRKAESEWGGEQSLNTHGIQ